MSRARSAKGIKAAEIRIRLATTGLSERLLSVADRRTAVDPNSTLLRPFSGHISPSIGAAALGLLGGTSR